MSRMSRWIQAPMERRGTEPGWITTVEGDRHPVMKIAGVSQVLRLKAGI